MSEILTTRKKPVVIPDDMPVVVTTPALDHSATSAIAAQGVGSLASAVSTISLEETTPLELRTSAGPMRPDLSAAAAADSAVLSCPKQLPTDPVQVIPPVSSNNSSGLWSTNGSILKDKR